MSLQSSSALTIGGKMADNDCNNASSSFKQDDQDNKQELQPSVVDADTVTMIDVLEEEEELEENAFAVLGGSDDKHCTYYKVIVVLIV